MELHHPPVNLKVVTVIFGQALSELKQALFPVAVQIGCNAKN
jgi:hypothetical protein